MKKDSKKNGASPIYRAFQDRELVLRRFLSRFLSNRYDIDDVCQETIMRALEAEKSRDIEEPGAFLFGVSKNIVRKHLDKQSKSLIDYIEDFTPLEYVSTDQPSIDEILDDRRKMQIFTEAVATLPRQCQRVFVMKKVYGYSHNEIASKLDISISTTEKHVAMGLKRCAQFMKNKLELERSDPVSLLKNTESLNG